MTVTGATTAVVAGTTYVPPFKSVNSYAPAASITGTVTGPVSNNPTVSAGASAGDYATAYLSAHMMSWPSYRYIYLLWVVFALIAFLYVLAHQLRLGASSSGAALSKWAIKRRPIGKRRSGGARGRALASNGVLLTSFVIFVVAVVLTFLGPDYIAPTKSIFSFRRQFLLPGQIQTASPSYGIDKSIWTMASRLGDTAFAIIPLAVLLALKSPPVALLAWRGLAHLYSDKLATFHKVTAWMVWGATTAHVALWTVQLFMDKRNGSAAWFSMWTNYRFVAGAVAYAAMTGVMVASFRIVRQKRYEFFYITHVTLVFLTIGLSALHHPVLWFWMAAALGLWGLERLWRLIRFWRINSGSAKSASGRRSNNPTFLASQYEDLPQTDSYAMAEFPSRTSYVDKSLPRPPPIGGLDSPGEWSPASTPRGSFEMGRSNRDEFGQMRDGGGGYAEGSLQPLGAFEGRYSGAESPRRHGGFPDPYDSRGGSSTPQIRRSAERGRSPGYQPYPDRGMPAPQQASAGTTLRPSSTASTLAPIPAGHALAQLLPSRTIRLTARLSRPLRWAPGQSVLLYLPELSKIQSHPFTITHPPNTDGEIILLVKARKGLTRRLYDTVRDRHQHNLTMEMASGKGGEGSRQRTDTAPVFIRTKVDGPFGSAGRVKWGDSATVVIICGGSGVSFGVSVLEGVCGAMRAGKGGKTRRVRFCWVARAYAEIAWVAHQLQRCQAMVPPEALQIQIYITNTAPLPSRSRNHKKSAKTAGAYDQPSTDDLAPPRAAFAKSNPRSSSPSSDQTFGRRSQSMDSIHSVASDMSIDQPYGGGYSDHLDVDEHLVDNYADVIDLTNYEDEDDVDDPREEALSSSVREQGKIRRARSRRVARGDNHGDRGRPGSTLVPNATSPGVPSRLSRLGRFEDDQPSFAAHRAGMAKSASAPMGFQNSQDQAIYHPAPRSGRSNLALSAYDQFEPADQSAGIRGGRHSMGPASSPGLDGRLPRPSTSYDLSSPHPPPTRSRLPSSSLAPPAVIDVQQPYLPAHTKRGSYASSFADPYATYDPFSSSGRMGGASSPGGSSVYLGYYGDEGDRGSIAGDSMRPIRPNGPDGGFRASRTGSMILLDEAAFGSGSRKSLGGGVGPGVASTGNTAAALALAEGLWVDMADYESMAALSELAISGKPALGAMLEEEIAQAGGSLIVATCGPTTLNTVVRNLVAKHINPSKIRNGDKSGHIAIYSEDYDA